MEILTTLTVSEDGTLRSALEFIKGVSGGRVYFIISTLYSRGFSMFTNRVSAARGGRSRC